MTLAHIFCAAAVCSLMQQSFPSAGSQALAAASADELLQLCSLLQLRDETSLLATIAQSQMSPVPAIDPRDISWLLGLFSAASSPKLHACVSDYPEKKLLKFCGGELFQVKKDGSFVLPRSGGLELPAADTVENKVKRCVMFSAAIVLSSNSLHAAVKSTDVASTVSSGSCSNTGKRSPEQRDSYFTGREPELKRLCEVIQAVLLNTPVTPAPMHVAVLGVPGMGKSLLVSQALLEMQISHLGRAHEVYFMKLRGRGSVSVEEDLVVQARSLGSRIGVFADTAPHVALTNLKAHLSSLRFVAVVDDANSEGLQAAALWIPVSTASHAILVTSQQPAEELASIEAVHGRFEKIALSEFDSGTSVALLQKLCDRCPAVKDDVGRLQDVAARLHHLPLGVRLFGYWSQGRYQRDVRAMKNAMRTFMKTAEAAASASGLPVDPAAATQTFCLEYRALTGACDEPGIAERLFCDWASNADIAEQEVLQSNDKYPRGLIGTVRLALHELHRLDADDAACSRQLLSILALCPPTNTPWSLLLGHDGVCVEWFQTCNCVTV